MKAAAASDSTDRIAILDVLRLLAAAWVMAYHWFFSGVYIHHYLELRTAALDGVSRYGFFGVHFFFVISGFVIAMSLQGRSAREFVTARLIRLYPAYWICGAITAVTVRLFGEGHFPCGSACLAQNATMLNGFYNNDFIDPVYWSLSAELQFYAMMALLVACRATAQLFGFVLAWVLLSASAFLAHNPLGLAYYLTEANWAPFFGCGAVLFLMRQHGPKLKYCAVLLLSWLLACCYVARDVQSMIGTTPPGLSFSVISGMLIFSGLLGLLLLISLRLVGIKASGLTRLCGGTSYTLYLLHQAVGITLLNQLKGRLPDSIVVMLVTVQVLALAILVWRFAERPLQTRLRTLLRREAAPAATRLVAP